MTYDPFDLEARQAVGREMTTPVSWVVSTRYRILEGLRQGYGVGAEQFDELLEGRDPAAADEFEQEVTQLDEEEEEKDAEAEEKDDEEDDDEDEDEDDKVDDE